MIEPEWYALFVVALLLVFAVTIGVIA